MKYIKCIKKIFILLLLFLLPVIAGCKKQKEPEEDIKKDYKLTIVSVNDFHGQLEEKDGKAGAARMAKAIKDQRAANPDYTIVLSAGDMFQGTGISNLNRGLDVINFMNMVGFDAMTIGNHEFDWGLNTILAYRDGNKENGEANFPFIGANIYQKSIDSIPDNVVKYTMLKRGDLNIAVIGFLGYDQTADIATAMIADYEFLQPLSIAQELVKKVRTEENADVVIICCHEDNDGINNVLASGTGDYQVDAIINGHTHVQTTERLIRDADKTIVPLVESGSSGEYVGVINLTINKDDKKVLGGSAVNLMMAKSKPKDLDTENFVNQIIENSAEVFMRVLCKTGRDIYRSTGITWAVQSLLDYANEEYGNFDLAVINDGGIRESAFPIIEGEDVTVNRVFQIMPFDNTVKTTSLLGKDVKTLLNITGLSFAGKTVVDGITYINSKEIEDNKYYNIISIDYIFDKPDYPFQKGINSNATGILFRDVLISDLEKISAKGETWQ